MGLWQTTPEVPEVVQDAIPYVLQFQQPDEAFAANGGFVYCSNMRGDIPIRNISYGSKLIYFNDKTLGTQRFTGR